MKVTPVTLGVMVILKGTLWRAWWGQECCPSSLERGCPAAAVSGPAAASSMRGREP